ncbi:hypothetical protein IFR04_007671 [Cadophora malorum]|uniref:Uncharacterized protein n=1 Tax=Cadophora malorum TaxID=108018 RepID=A0A8H7W6Q7_9HELO|nr:hypothetical protein IFR04_007671 [Cadophora malorum]
MPVYSAGGPYKAIAYFRMAARIAARNACEYVNPYDINDALKQIDARCPLYEAILSRWPGSNELVAKVNLGGDHICVY